MPRPAHLIPLSKTHCTAIGRVATEWAELENFVMFSVRVLLDGRGGRATYAVTANIQFMTACQILESLARVRVGNSEHVKKLCKAIKDLNDDSARGRNPRARRNAIVHGSWVPGPARFYPAVVTHKARGTIKSLGEPYSAKEINAFADEISGRLAELMQLAEPVLASACQRLGTPWHGLAK